MDMREPMRRWRRRLALWRAASLTRRFHREVCGQRLTSKEVGDLGEVIAAKWLCKHGRKVLYRNFAAPEGGEVDIVCRHGATLAFNEVKTRTSVGLYRPADAVNADKEELIQRGAKRWLAMLGNPVIPFRFDIVEVYLIEGELPRVNVIERAFTMPEGNLTGRV
ncbi:MAG: YraN family protein [Verrucomicrobiaceae bacterium]|nr:YraN family protein [Verrucomicrobiaceae bacterium]